MPVLRRDHRSFSLTHRIPLAPRVRMPNLPPKRLTSTKPIMPFQLLANTPEPTTIPICASQIPKQPVPLTQSLPQSLFRTTPSIPAHQIPKPTSTFIFFFVLNQCPGHHLTPHPYRDPVPLWSTCWSRSELHSTCEPDFWRAFRGLPDPVLVVRFQSSVDNSEPVIAAYV